MTHIDLTIVEEQLHGRLLFNVCALTAEGRIDMPIGVLVRGSPALDEDASLRSVLALSEELAAAVRMRISLPGVDQPNSESAAHGAALSR